METELISKKDLLDLKGISYGQLYRWKRKNLIPEDWFIRKSTFTGQETFFPKEKILQRIDKIQEMKEDLSLDDLAEVFSPTVGDVEFSTESLVGNGIISEMAFNFFMDVRNFNKLFEFEDVIQVYLIDQLLNSGEINREEARMVLDLLNGKEEIFRTKPTEIVIVRKFGVSSSLLVSNQENVLFDNGTKIIKKVSIGTVAEELKSKLMGVK
ncbi:MAG: hypothetical protein K0R71_1356 [Bacillales bacterium]|jgi:hypothetical protein|nr:hypothetical protein [Bacillales bacterium]